MSEPHEEVEDQAWKAPSLPDTSDFSERLKRAKASSKNVSENRAPDKALDAKKLQAQRNDAFSLGLGLQIAYSIIGIPLFGFGFGALLDYFLKTLFLKGVLGFLGLVLAVFAAVILINRANREVK